MEAGGITSSQGRDEFLRLLTAQLKHQDPLDPVPQHEFLAQLAQFSTLEGIENTNQTMAELNNNFESLLQLERVNQGADVIGKHVTFYNEDGLQESTVSAVEGVTLADGELKLIVGSTEIPLGSVIGIRQESETADA
ncbi:MAG: hypothetical protein KDA60_17380 [Planctomycetales bacterium]|nr:hypothetical protein [Planctomycetales bacterium]